MSYLIDSYTTPDGDRDVLLVALPTNEHSYTLVDVPSCPPLEPHDVHILERWVDRLDRAAERTREHIARSIALGRPASNATYLADMAQIVRVQHEARSQPAAA